MRRIIIAAAFCLAAVTAGAQTMSEAFNYTDNNYYGTARSMALGNAVTALGGDLGTIGINPAGSAIAPYSQFTISPGVTLLTNTSAYSTRYDEDYSNYLTNRENKFIVPNIALAMKMDTGKRSGIRSYTIGFAANTTNQYLNSFVGRGTNYDTSILGSFGAGASPYSPSELNNFNNFRDSSIPWNYLLAYQSGMIADAYDEYGQQMVDDAGYYTYLGASEAMYNNGDGTYDIRTPGALDQLSSVYSYGSATDIIMNVGFNCSDNFYFGFNLGIPVATYGYSEYFRESAVDPSLFGIEYMDGNVANFSYSTYGYSQNTDVTGAYAKLGFIWLPFGGLRVGAAFQTPTAMTIKDRWYLEGATNFTDSRYNTTASSPDNEYSYNLTSPWRFNAGIAYTCGLGLLSADFEMADYSTMRFSTIDEGGFSYPDYFSVENSVFKEFAGMQYAGRFGAEIKLTPDFALRAGYTFKTSPEYYRYDTFGDKYSSTGYLNWYDEFDSGRDKLFEREAFPDMVTTVSGGFGYSSAGSFFADVALRCTKYSTSYFNPYSDYISGNDDYLPETMQTRKLTDVVLTLGWRF